MGWFIAAILIGAWLVWLAIYLFINVYVPHWQREQAAHIEAALQHDCGIVLHVAPASVPLTTRPVWERSYSATGQKLVCSIGYRSGEWECTRCGGP